jgi:dTDP-4-dehydrorhamnose 3,5-epimerase
MKKPIFNGQSLMEISEIKGSFLGRYPIYTDLRGSFRRALDFNEISALLNSMGEPAFEAVNTNIAFNASPGTWRGLHIQKRPFTENKIVVVVDGSILDVIVDMRKESPTYLQSFQVELSAHQGNFVFIPKGCAHGYLTLESNTHVMYTVDAPYSSESELGFCINDPDLGINLEKDIILMSKKDASWPHGSFGLA